MDRRQRKLLNNKSEQQILLRSPPIIDGWQKEEEPYLLSFCQAVQALNFPWPRQTSFYLYLTTILSPSRPALSPSRPETRTRLLPTRHLQSTSIGKRWQIRRWSIHRFQFHQSSGTPPPFKTTVLFKLLAPQIIHIVPSQ